MTFTLITKIQCSKRSRLQLFLVIYKRLKTTIETSDISVDNDIAVNWKNTTHFELLLLFFDARRAWQGKDKKGL